MSLTTIGGRQVVAAGSFIIPIGSNEATLDLPFGQLTIRFSPGRSLSEVKATGPSSAVIEMQTLGHGQDAYFDGAVAGYPFGIHAFARGNANGMFHAVTYSFTR